MKYNLTNKTIFPTDRIEEIIKLVAPKGIKKCSISVQYTKDNSYIDGEAVPFGKRKTVKVFIGKNNQYPFKSNPTELKKVGYTPQFLIKSDEEVILCVLAHELRHIWQGNVSKKDLWSGEIIEYVSWDGEKSVCIYKTENDACKYTKKMLQKYRKMKSKELKESYKNI